MCPKLLEGDGGEDGVIDLRLRTITLPIDGKRWVNNCKDGTKGGTIGKDGFGDGVVATCPESLQYWMKEGQVYELAGHLAHEYLHILGFDHRVPYKIVCWAIKYEDEFQSAAQ